MSKRLISSTAVERELARRMLKTAPDFFDNGAFPLQETFIRSDSRFKALFATRRFGKSYTGGLHLAKTAYDHPGSTVLYIALTRDSAYKIMWRNVIKKINKKYNLGMKFNNTQLSATLPNGSVIYLMGVDSSEEEKDKLLGQKYKLAVIDECASYTIDLRHLVYGILKPAMADENGTVVMLGTPGNLTTGLFFDVTTGKEPGWEVVRADTKDNPYMREAWAKEIAELTANQPYIVETPMFKQMYLGQWVVDEDALVYKFSPERNVYTTMPMYAKGDWQYIMGVDLGYEDASAFTIVAFHEYDKNLYIVDVHKQPHMDITDVANKIKELSAKHNVHKVVIDGANKQAVEEIQKRHQIPLIPADKRGKEDFIEIMNSELIQGKVKVNQLLGEPLMTEWQNLVWKMKNDKPVLPKKENPACDNHLADATLYAWRFCYQYLSEKPVPKPAYGTPAWAEQEVTDMEQAAIDYFTEQEKGSDWDF